MNIMLFSLFVVVLFVAFLHDFEKLENEYLQCSPIQLRFSQTISFFKTSLINPAHIPRSLRTYKCPI